MPGGNSFASTISGFIAISYKANTAKFLSNLRNKACRLSAFPGMDAHMNLQRQCVNKEIKDSPQFLDFCKKVPTIQIDDHITAFETCKKLAENLFKPVLDEPCMKELCNQFPSDERDSFKLKLAASLALEFLAVCEAPMSTNQRVHLCLLFLDIGNANKYSKEKINDLFTEISKSLSQGNEARTNLVIKELNTFLVSINNKVFTLDTYVHMLDCLLKGLQEIQQRLSKNDLNINKNTLSKVYYHTLNFLMEHFGKDRKLEFFLLSVTCLRHFKYEGPELTKLIQFIDIFYQLTWYGVAHDRKWAFCSAVTLPLQKEFINHGELLRKHCNASQIPDVHLLGQLIREMEANQLIDGEFLKFMSQHAIVGDLLLKPLQVPLLVDIPRGGAIHHFPAVAGQPPLQPQAPQDDSHTQDATPPTPAYQL